MIEFSKKELSIVCPFNHYRYSHLTFTPPFLTLLKAFFVIFNTRSHYFCGRNRIHVGGNKCGILMHMGAECTFFHYFTAILIYRTMLVPKILASFKRQSFIHHYFEKPID